MEHGQLLHIDPTEGGGCAPSARPRHRRALAGAYHALGDPTRLTLALALGATVSCACATSAGSSSAPRTWSPTT